MRSWGVATLVAVAAVPSAVAQDAPAALGVSADVRVVSRYIWRGYDLSAGRASLQPSVLFTAPAGLSLGFWGSSALDRRTQFDEAQISVGLTRTLGALSLDAGFLAYVQPGTETAPSSDALDPLAPSASGEAYLALTAPMGPVSATLTWSRGMGSAVGTSLNLWLEASAALGAVQLEPYAQLDYLDQYDAPATLRDRLGALEVGVPVRVPWRGMTLELAGHLTWTISPWVHASNRAGNAEARAVRPWVALAVGWSRE